MQPQISKAQAAAHEALYPRVERLTRQAEAIGTKRPNAPVPEETRTIAEGLLFDVQAFRPSRTRRGLPPAASSFAALASQLGQALAALDAFEAAHSEWNGVLKCRVWRTGFQPEQPVARLRQEPEVPLSPGTRKVMGRMIAEMLRLTHNFGRANS
jgi:hypothetical protein